MRKEKTSPETLQTQHRKVCRSGSIWKLGRESSCHGHRPVWYRPFGVNRIYSLAKSTIFVASRTRSLISCEKLFCKARPPDIPHLGQYTLKTSFMQAPFSQNLRKFPFFWKKCQNFIMGILENLIALKKMENTRPLQIFNSRYFIRCLKFSAESSRRPRGWWSAGRRWLY